MPKDRYDFDKQFPELHDVDVSKLNTKWYDDRMLNNEPDAKITARREARKAKYAKNAKAEVISDEQIKTAKKKVKRRIRVGRASLVFGCLVLVIVFVAYAGVKLGTLQVEKKTAQAELDALNIKKQQLEAELEELDSEEYIEDAARSELHMIKEGETMYVVDPSDETETEEDSNAAK